MYKTLCVLFVLLKICRCEVVPDDYIINVTANCPDSIYSGAATVHIKTDLPSSKPFAICAYDKEVLFDPDQMGTWILSVHFDTNVTLGCAFNQKSNMSSVYSISVYVPVSDKVLTVNIPEKIVNCIYDPIGDQISPLQQLEESNKPVKQIIEHKASPSTSRIDVCIADVSGECIVGSVRIGRSVMVKAVLKATSPTEQGFKTLSCDAIGTGYKIPILIGGCGDGSVIPKDLGFNTVGTVALSPAFKSFRVPGGNTLTFDCSFVVCGSRCDGSSCETARRKKRDTLSVQQKEYSDTIHVPKSAVLEPDVKFENERLPLPQNQKHVPQANTLTQKNTDSNPTTLQIIPSVEEWPISKEGPMSLWTLEISLLFMLAISLMIFMIATVKILARITKSVSEIQDRFDKRNALNRLEMLS